MTAKELLVDGYISHSFQNRPAQQLFCNVLKSDIPPTVTWSYPDREGLFFLVAPVTPQALEQPFPASSRLLDRALVDRGSVVPQRMWTPHTITDRRQHVEEAVLQMPIFFEDINGRLGLPLEAAAAGRCHGLRNAQQLAPLGEKSTTHIRIGWLGYKPFKRQVQIRDETSEHNPITISRFAHHIGRSVDAFLKTCEPDPGNTDDAKWQPEQWQVSSIQRSNIIVIGAIHVSAGSWMPILQLNRYIL